MEGSGQQKIELPGFNSKNPTACVKLKLPWQRKCVDVLIIIKLLYASNEKNLTWWFTSRWIHL